MALNVLEGKTVKQMSPEEIKAFALVMSPWVTSISGTPTIDKVVDMDDQATDVSSTVVAAGAASVSTTTITLPKIQLLTEGKTYRVHVLFSDGTNTWNPVFKIKCSY